MRVKSVLLPTFLLVPFIGGCQTDTVSPRQTEPVSMQDAKQAPVTVTDNQENKPPPILEPDPVRETTKGSRDKIQVEVKPYIATSIGRSADEAQPDKKSSTDHSEQQASTQLAKVALSQQDRARIKKLRAQAEDYISASMFVGVGDKNAGAAYRKILEIDPNDQQAKNGLTQIASIIARAAAVSFKAGNMAAAKLQVERGLQLQPKNPSLLQLQQQLKQSK